MQNIQRFREEHHVDRVEEFKAFLELMAADSGVVVLAIEDEEPMGKTWLVGKMMHHCQQPAVAMPMVHINFGGVVEEDNYQSIVDVILEIRDTLGQQYPFGALEAALRAYRTSATAIKPSALLKFSRKLTEFVEEGHLVQLAAAIDDDYEEIVDTRAPLGTKVFKLVDYAARRNKLPQMIEAIPEIVRVDVEVDWWEGLNHPGSNGASSAGEAAPDREALVTDHGALSVLIKQMGESARDEAYRQMTSALITDLRSIVEQFGRRLVLAFDGYEESPIEFRAWFENDLLPRLNKGELHNVCMIVGGRARPYINRTQFPGLLVHSIDKLPPFSEADLKEYFEKRRVPKDDPDINLRTILKTTKGRPSEIALQVDRLLEI